MNAKQTIKLYMDLAIRVAEMSHSKRNKVGSVLVKYDNIISFGWNGMPTHFDNCCEDVNGNTRPEVIHAEMNVLAKLARTGVSSNGATLFITLSPCYECSKLIIQSGISEVIYLTEYRDTTPIDFLRRADITVTSYKDLV